MLLKPKIANNAPYGAYELKRWYQPNMASAVLITGIAVGLIWTASWVYRTLTHVDEDEAPTVVIESVMDLGPPPSIVQKPPQIEIAKPKLVQPKVGIPKPVADDEILDEEVVLATKEELADINVSQIDLGGDGDANIEIRQDILPPPDKFIKVEKQPEVVVAVQPEYPRLAREANIEGLVWVKILVDKDGNPRDAIVIKESGAKAGFEAAALKAAKQFKFKPAIQNGRPIAVWVSIPFEFKLRQGK